MLRQVLEAIENSNGSFNFESLARQLDVEPTALRGMIEFWVRKGALQIVGSGMPENCGAGRCSTGRSCPGIQGCPFTFKLPQVFSLVREKK